MTHLFVPKVADYRERITLYFDDAVFELNFPSPYLNHFPTKLTVASTEGNTWRHTEYRGSYEEAFIRELMGFWKSVTSSEPARNTVEDAERDLRLVAELADMALRDV